MGETRAKKPSKRSLKAYQEPDTALTVKLEDLQVQDVQHHLTEQSPSASLSPRSYGTPAPSAKTSRDSMRSSALINRNDEVVDTPVIEVKQTESKGIAVFSTRKIAAGTLVLKEVPLIRLTREQEEKGTADEVLDFSYESIDKSMRKSFLSLFDSQKATFSRVKSTYYSNCYNLEKYSDFGGSCIGAISSRLNHSCIPNVQFSFDEAEGKMLFYALKAIPRGKEICSNYDTVFDTKASRQRKQMLHYGFRCDCEACEPQTDFWKKSDERRTEIIRARRSVRESQSSWDDGKLEATQIAEVLTQLERMESAMVKEGLFGEPLVNAYKSLAKWAERARDSNAVRKWKLKELQVSSFCFGEQSARAHALRDKLKDPID